MHAVSKILCSFHMHITWLLPLSKNFHPISSEWQLIRSTISGTLSNLLIILSKSSAKRGTASFSSLSIYRKSPFPFENTCLLPNTSLVFNPPWHANSTRNEFHASFSTVAMSEFRIHLGMILKSWGCSTLLCSLQFVSISKTFSCLYEFETRILLGYECKYVTCVSNSLRFIGLGSTAGSSA